jgi:phosphatidylinositol glycan class V
MLFWWKYDSLLAAFLFALASLTRSNGVLLAGFFAYDILINLTTRPSFGTTIKNGLCIIVTVSTFFVFQYYGYLEYCHHLDRPWCHDRLPLLYSFVQREYWYV